MAGALGGVGDATVFTHEQMIGGRCGGKLVEAEEALD